MIRFLLLAGIDWTDSHQPLMLAGAALCIVIGLAVAP